MEKVVIVDGKEVGFKATALTLRLYRHLLGKDMVSDMAKLMKAYRKAEALGPNATEEEKQEAQLKVADLEIFENAAWVMARQYDPANTAKSPDEWLDGFNTFAIMEVMPTIVELWRLNQQTTSVPNVP